jgi:hypothetical protein
MKIIVPLEKGEEQEGDAHEEKLLEEKLKGFQDLQREAQDKELVHQECTINIVNE